MREGENESGKGEDTEGWRMKRVKGEREGW